MKKDFNCFGKNIVFINSGGKKKKFTLEKAKKLGANIILVNRKLDVPKNLVDYFIEADTYNHSEVIEKLNLFLKQNPGVSFNGAITFWEDDIPLLARVCDEFKLCGNTYETAVKTRNKYKMRKRFQETGLGSPNFYLVKNVRDLKKAIDSIGFPAIMKPVWGSDSEFVVLVKNEEEAKNTLSYLLKNCTEQFNPIFKYNDSSFLFEEYMEGTEVSIEAFSQYGIPYVIGINEKQPIKPPYFVEYGDIAPGRVDEKTEAKIIKLAESALIALGVQNSLAHIEIKVTPEGPKIVEAASRMGGDDIYFNAKEVWGVDMVETGLQIALNMPIKYEKREPRNCVVCRYFIPDFSGILTNIQDVEEVKRMKDVLHLAITKNVGDAVLVPPEGFENIGWVVTKGETYQEAETVMNKVMKKIALNVTKFHKDSSLGKTSRESSLASASIVRSQIIRASKIEKIRSIDLDALKKLNIGIFTSESVFGETIKRILKKRGYNINLFDVSEMPLQIKKIQGANLDLVMNFSEGIYDAQVLRPQIATLFDILQLPYAGSGPATIALSFDKIKMKKLLDYHGIPTPAWDYIENMDDKITEKLDYPLIVKPANSENTLGISNESVVMDEKDLWKQIRIIVEKLKRPVLIEEYIEGDEIDAPIIGNGEEAEALPLIGSIFDKMPQQYWHIYHSDVKSDKNLLNTIRIEKPAKIPKKLETVISEMALDVYNIFDCRDYAKIEIRIDRKGNPFVIELDCSPGFQKTDFLSMSAKLAGYSYEELLEEVIYTVIQRYKGHPPFYNLISMD